MKTQLISTMKTALLASAMLLFAAAFAALAGKGNNGNPRILPPQSHSHGKTYGEWAAALLQWASSIPADTNPFNDTTGVNAAIGQSGSVWFLAGAFTSTTVTRSVTIPSGTALFIPLVGTVWVTLPTDPPMTIQEIRDLLTFLNSGISDVTCEVDGVPVKSPLNYVEQSPVFSVTLPANNLLGVDAGTYSPCVDEGYYLMLAPLSKGEHTIHFTSNHVLFEIVVDITYHITVR